MPNYLNYRKSISDELISIKNRVRDFIDTRHWGEDGRYKEIILTKTLKAHLPDSVSIGTGFVTCENQEITSQIDIIIYRSDMPKMFEIDNFVIVPAESVLAIIEVKTKLSNSKLQDAIKKSHQNGVKIRKPIFNGIFSYENDVVAIDLGDDIADFAGEVNNIALGKDYFLKYWNAGVPYQCNEHNRYSLYRINDLSFGYFILNLIEDIHISLNNREITETMRQSLYPIEECKEAHKERDFNVDINNIRERS